MFDFFEKGGLMLLPIVLCSIVALGIIVERFWSLKRNKILPPDLVPQVWKLSREEKLDAMAIRRLKVGSPLGAILAAGLSNSRFGREIMKESIEEVGRQVAHDLERYLTALGTISAITPLLGLLGTVVGMIKVFSAIMSQGVGDPSVLAGGISEALITTAAGLAVAIPSLMFHRYFEGRVDDLVLNMEEESLKLIEMIHGEREDSSL
ncbi:MAG TPA: MotA/TolQ/ExbB proton channel family protein [Methylococcaceae bacterium]|jgi:biopolymer transport protein ExbB|nr:MotA/TolQ/ExbB proton channel family protein [Methylococcaceae bacterium]HIA45241.1 MotA/TolQ/ExbB proton channel family protein [Methylococcaceae bacterium]HIB61616.1 MotA/TolQ/ExbB proton channel family protein [Methylococcaceae bacterium]HIN68593.1 MotA/TolQ/ExbB proton channel family protein [Methylococcales bacterium]HIO43988.1 MotA/TolQ/ExbB proton channel family protein [Methylococcales bacterium]